MFGLRLMSKKAFELKLARLESLREHGATQATTEALRQALQDRNNYVVAKAARIAADLGLTALIPELTAAFDRFFADPVKSDPQCWAKHGISKALIPCLAQHKHGISKALADLGCEEAGVFLRALTYVQPEPVWGGSEDTAGPLRATCAAGLVQCRDISGPEILSNLTEVLVDRDKAVRMSAADAISRLGRPEGGLLLRFKALSGDQEPEVLGACFSALLSLEGPRSIAFVARFLDAAGDAGSEAALALGLTRDPEAFQALKRKWESESGAQLAPTLLLAMALTRHTEAIELLLELVRGASPYAEAAIEALASAHLTPEIRSLTEAAVQRNRNPRLRAAFDRHFGSSSGGTSAG